MVGDRHRLNRGRPGIQPAHEDPVELHTKRVVGGDVSSDCRLEALSLHAWGRGNGFAAFGLMEALTYLPASWADRAAVLASYQKLMKGLSAQQAPDGMAGYS